MITTIVFDIGGVFFHQPEELTSELRRNLGLADPAVADEVMYGGELWDVYKRGGMTEQEYWNDIIAKLPVHYEGPWSTLCTSFERGVVLDTELASLARKLKQKYHVHALSNAGAELERRLHHFGIADLFSEVINSHYVKMAKPDEKIYRYTCEHVGAKPDEILFVDDKHRNTRVADAMGFHTHVYTTAQSFQKFLLQSEIDSEESR